MSALQLINIDGYMIGNKFIPTSQLQNDAIEWAGIACTPIIGNQFRQIPDELIFRLLAFGLMPFSIQAQAPQTILQIELFRFPYAIDSVQAYWEFGVRMCPKFGRIGRIALLPDSTVAVNHFESGPGCLFCHLANGSMRVEMYYGLRQLETMQPMEPRRGFEAERFTDNLTDM